MAYNSNASSGPYQHHNQNTALPAQNNANQNET